MPSFIIPIAIWVISAQRSANNEQGFSCVVAPIILQTHGQLVIVRCTFMSGSWWDVHCEMLVVSGSWWDVHCEMFIVRCSKWDVHCEMLMVRRSLWVARAELLVLRYSWWDAQWELSWTVAYWKKLMYCSWELFIASCSYGAAQSELLKASWSNRDALGSWSVHGELFNIRETINAQVLMASCYGNVEENGG